MLIFRYGMYQYNQYVAVNLYQMLLLHCHLLLKKMVQFFLVVWVTT